MSESTNKNLKVLRTDDDRRMHPYCLDCKLKCQETGKDWSRVTRKCTGIYSDADFKELSEARGIPVDEIKELVSPAEWIYQNLNMTPFWYQDRTLRCTSIRRALRWGRRTGKTETIAAYILYVAFTNARKKILCITPGKSQVKEINDRIFKFINDNPKLKSDVTRSVQQPYYEIVFANESRIRFFVAGTSGGANAGVQVRGQEADLIFIDEMDYLDDAATAAILPILSDPSRDGTPVEFIASTTPCGSESSFFKICHNDDYKEFHYPSWCRPDWDDEKEVEARQNSKTQSHYEHEYLAEWGTKSDGVFRRFDVIQAQEHYRYFGETGFGVSVEWNEMKPYPGHWTYIMGVDWNGPNSNGTRICVVGFDPTRGKFILVYRQAVSVEEFSLSFAVKRMVEINRIWRCKAAYIDAGFGQMQDETLRAIGRAAMIDQHAGRDYDHADLMWAEDLHAINFGGWITYDTTEEGKAVEKKIPTKNYMVENFQRFFEQRDFWFSRDDEEFKQQLLGYHTPRQSARGYPIYVADSEVGDHDLDAVMLALFGFNQEMGGGVHKRRSILDFAFVEYEQLKQPNLPDPMSNPLDYERAKEQQEKNGEERVGRRQIPNREITKSGDRGIPFGDQLVLIRGARRPVGKGRAGSGAVPRSRTSFLRRGRNGRR
jgi:hypothetical protein